jgi:hypothetical protein
MNQIVPEGFALSIDDQIYTYVGSEPHTRRDGTQTLLMRWETHCPDCSTVFVTTTPRIVRQIRRRRCDNCKNPGLGVKWTRKHGVSDALEAPPEASEASPVEWP